VTPEERQQIEQRIDLDAIRRRWCTPHDKGSAHQAVVEALCGEVRRLLDEVDRQAHDVLDWQGRFRAQQFMAEQHRAEVARLSSAIAAAIPVIEAMDEWRPIDGIEALVKRVRLAYRQTSTTESTTSASRRRGWEGHDDHT
jgi:hypothetical protein